MELLSDFCRFRRSHHVLFECVCQKIISARSVCVLISLLLVSVGLDDIHASRADEQDEDCTPPGTIGVAVMHRPLHRGFCYDTRNSVTV